MWALKITSATNLNVGLNVGCPPPIDLHDRPAACLQRLQNLQTLHMPTDAYRWPEKLRGGAFDFGRGGI